MKITDKWIVKKFGLYGFFKNLRFFEPFLYLFFLKIGLSFLQIGVLISIREITRNILEIPSGIFADNYGRKRTLQLCFILYIISFLIFFLSNNFYISILAMLFFGSGEAFRSGTHKAIIFTYLDHHQLADKKVEVYGFTKSYSLIGSSLSAIIGALIVFVRSNYRLVFIISIVPYIIDFFLISSYPDYVNGVIQTEVSLKIMLESVKRSFSNLKNIVYLQKGIINSSIYDGYFKALKDYLQPVLKAQIIGFPLLSFLADPDKRVSILLGLSYFLINIISSFTTRNAYRLKKYSNESFKILNLSFVITTLGIVLIGIFSGMFSSLNIPVIIILLYLIYHVIRDARRPFMLDYLGDLMAKEERATMLSLESQLRTVVIIILSPLLGLTADLWGLGVMFAAAGVSMLLLYSITLLSKAELQY